MVGPYSLRAMATNSAGQTVGDSGCQSMTVRLGTAAIVFDDPVAYAGNNVRDTYTLRVVKQSNETGPAPGGQVQIALCSTRTYPTTCAANPPNSVAYLDMSGGAASTGTITMSEPSYVLTQDVKDYNSRYQPVSTLTSDGLAKPPTPTPTNAPTSTARATATATATSPTATPRLPTATAAPFPPTETVTPVPSTATPRPPTATATATATPSPTPPPPSITISVSPSTLNLGALQPDCGAVPAGASCTSTSNGATYIYGSAITVSVTSSAAWSAGCGRQPQTSLSASADRLAIRPVGTGTWYSVPIVNGSSVVGAGCVSSFPAGKTTLTFDLSVVVRGADPPGALGDIVIFEVQPS